MRFRFRLRKNRGKINELMTKLGKSGSDSESVILLILFVGVRNNTNILVSSANYNFTTIFFIPNKILQVSIIVQS